MLGKTVRGSTAVAWFFALAIGVGLAATAAAKPTRGLTIDDMLAMQRVSEPAVSPDGTLVAFTVRDTDVEANRGRTDVWLAAVDGSRTRWLTDHAENDGSPAWSADGKWIYFLSTRSGSSQVWRVAPTGGAAEQVTKLPLDINGFEPFPDGKRLALAIDVWPAARTLAASAERDAAEAKKKVKARVYDRLLFRHWDSWEDGKYSHLFVWSPERPADARDLTPTLFSDTPTHPFGGMEEISVSPDGAWIAYVVRVGGRSIAWSTNTEVFAVRTVGRMSPVLLTEKSPGYDLSPTWSPDGKSVAVLSMKRAGYEADRQRVVMIDVATRQGRVLTEGWDRSASAIEFSADGKTIYTSADDTGNHALFAIDVATGKPTALVAKGYNADPKRAGSGVVFVRDTLSMPAELFWIDGAGGQPRQLTRFNDKRTRGIAFGAYEQFNFTGAHGDTVHGYVVKPAGHKGGKVPVAFIIHGGPQGSMSDHFHYRWNPQVFAGAGYGVVFIDFHGSTGYGQAFTDAIRGDWGGAPYEDLMKGLDAALARYSWLDGNRVAALGASYGGYMINWINGHTDRFKALVCHDGNLDERMAYFDTEELWFPEWEHGGTPWENPGGYLKHNPIDHVKKWKTPTLVIHGGNDFRVVDTQGMSTFTALQRRGIPSRFVHFPDQNHWVLKPQESRLWHQEVIRWINRFTNPSALGGIVGGAAPPRAVR